jgi:hypothetical protein
VGKKRQRLLNSSAAAGARTLPDQVMAATPGARAEHWHRNRCCKFVTVYTNRACPINDDEKLSMAGSALHGFATLRETPGRPALDHRGILNGNRYKLNFRGSIQGCLRAALSRSTPRRQLKCLIKYAASRGES